VKIKIFISFIFLNFCGLTFFAETRDSATLKLSEDTTSVFNISYDVKTFKKFKDDKSFDYYKSNIQRFTLSEFLQKKIRELWLKYFKFDLSNKQVSTFLWIVSGVVLAIIIVILYFFKPAFFYVNKKKKIDFSIENMDVNELDFENLIQNAINHGQFSIAIRWKYIQMLKFLHDKELITWDSHKTVIEYVNEITKPELKPIFKEASQHFLYFRYGNFDATRENWIYFNDLINNVID